MQKCFLCSKCNLLCASKNAEFVQQNHVESSHVNTQLRARVHPAVCLQKLKHSVINYIDRPITSTSFLLRTEGKGYDYRSVIVTTNPRI